MATAYNLDEPAKIKIGDNDCVDVVIPEKYKVNYPHIVEICVPLENETYIALIDYASAGKLWSEESKIAAWIKVRD